MHVYSNTIELFNIKIENDRKPDNIKQIQKLVEIQLEKIMGRKIRQQLLKNGNHHTDFREKQKQ